MSLPDKRLLNIAGFLICSGLMAYALYAEHVLMLMPCPLCVFQRIAVIAMGLVFLAAALHHPRGKGRFAYTGLMALAAAGGIAVAGRHVWLQNLPPDRVPACGPDLAYMVDTFPFADVLKMVFTGSGECATIDWQFLGLTMPAWVLIAVVGLGAAGIWNNLRSVAPRADASPTADPATAP
ncbi:MAG: disulfide bond formation protein B [Woeseiaceae bacterium]|nr:disulfide bond formation protein B [Woeseiaceae bacterium]